MRKCIVFLCILYLAACTVPRTQTYTLYVSDEGNAAATGTDSSVNIIVNAEQYLRQSYIAFRTSPYQIEVAKYAKWDSSPGRIVKNRLKDALSGTGVFREVRTDHVASDGSYSLTIDLKQFERLDEGNDYFGMLVFDTDFRSPDNSNLYRGTFMKKVKLESRDFSSLAKGLSTALKEGIDEVIANMISSVVALSSSQDNE